MTNENTGSPGCDYELLDSGAGAKLERFGERVLQRPSSLCIWNRRLSAEEWRADAEFSPGSGWRTRGKPFEAWTIRVDERLELVLRLQQNGQIGFFGEHVEYLPEVRAVVRAFAAGSQGDARVLNLFAYTGMASLAAWQEGAEVTHVDTSAKSFEWLKENLARNGAPQDALRCIKEDAVKFVERERRRGRRYEIIIADPPGFSRLSKAASWNLEEILPQLVADLAALVPETGGVVFLSSHQPHVGPELLGNLFVDAAERQAMGAAITGIRLGVRESDGARILPAGSLVQVRLAPKTCSSFVR